METPREEVGSIDLDSLAGAGGFARALDSLDFNASVGDIFLVLTDGIIFPSLDKVVSGLFVRKPIRFVAPSRVESQNNYFINAIGKRTDSDIVTSAISVGILGIFARKAPTTIGERGIHNVLYSTRSYERFAKINK